MRKAILMMLLAIVSSSAAAEWVYVGGNDNLSSYVNLSTIRKAGNKVKMWSMYNFKSAQTAAAGDKYLSRKGQGEYDCKEEQSRTLIFSWHSENMGVGNTVYSNAKPSEWEPVTPDSRGEELLKFACKKR